MFAQINGTRIFYDIEGAGYVPQGAIMHQKPVCFVLHGGPGGDHTTFKPALTPLSEKMQLVYIDNRGSGLSDRGPQSSYTLENNTSDLEELRQQLGLEKIVLLGHSYGGMVALRFAIEYPQSVSSLLLLTTSPSYKFIERAKQFIREKGTTEQKRMANILWQGAFESQEQLIQYYEVMEPLYSYTYNRNPSKEELKRKEETLSRSNRNYQAINEGFGGFLRKYNVIKQLSSITCPTLIMAGRHDWITSVEESLVLAEKIPNNELVVFEGSSHSVFKDEYERFISVVSTFINKNLN
ncbi:alpha/beta fold hydrolase [Aneurinibacillus sp. Ricciae_BoGa-3]|uniref:alpha/beta fold hydrolase n=1 Tax=Aneurinibacillus sp. Ricciae_BoGa-3 TaxID=3022697 RepID=UPI002341A753|nr:alpha/beta fold hydrolase [Aneurinibacillus sp. Ricciae_BoGa-3]WCK52358.1 alpha/beta fold hydrolase [Aneurinibacillus sp. Ricciae_BoGa-3]